MRDTHREGRKDRLNRFAEIPLHLSALGLVQILVFKDGYPCLGKGRPEFFTYQPRDEECLTVQLITAGAQFLRLCQTAMGQLLFLNPPLETADTFHCEFIIESAHNTGEFN